MKVWIICLVLVVMLTACSSIPVKTAVENTPISTPTITNTPTVAPSPTETANMEPTPTATEVPKSARPDFESMSDEELLQTLEEYGQFFAEQVDCSPGIKGLPTPSNIPEVVSVMSMSVTWNIEFLGTYQAPLTGKDGLPAGYINCLFFAASEPGKVISLNGGGELWGEELSAPAYINSLGLSSNNSEDGNLADPKELRDKMIISKEYEVEIPSLTASYWEANSVDIKIEKNRGWADRYGYVDGAMRIMIHRCINGLVGNNLGLVDGKTDPNKLFLDDTKPVNARIMGEKY